VAVGLERLPGCLAELGRNAGKGSARGVCGDALALPFADAIFDAVLSVNVLEAVPDRPLALAEMRRVLKPGGRIVLAHDDYESAVYAGTDRELTRRVVRAYADSTFASYAASDGQMGRHLWGHFSRAGFVESEIRVLPLVDVEYREPFLGWSLAQFDAGFVAAANDLTQLEIDRWHAALAAASARGDYLFCLNLYVCLGRKPLG
jgi:SAM-dependent methyltransferase